MSEYYTKIWGALALLLFCALCMVLPLASKSASEKTHFPHPNEFGASETFQTANSKDGDEQRRRLQFEGMFETPQAQKMRRKKAREAKEGGGGGGGQGRGGGRRVNRPEALSKAVEDITLNMDRYNLWWTGPPDSDVFKPAPWGAMHTESANAIFTMAMKQGQKDLHACSSPNDFKLFLGSARRVFQGDIVVAVDAGLVTADIRKILRHYRAVVYELPATLCAKETRSIFCGSQDERVPASVFRYFFYEKWATAYNPTSLILLADFRDILFQADPFSYHLDEWFPEFQLAVFQEFHPNMVINRCRFNRRVMVECYGQEALRSLGPRVIVSSGAAMGSRDAILLWSHHVTLQLQEAPGRTVETRCASGGVDHGFVNFLVYGNKLRPFVRVKVFPMGEGAVNTLGGLRPDTVVANITGDLRSFWKVLSDKGVVFNWNGEPSPVVHQLDHFYGELETLAKEVSPSPGLSGGIDSGWQALLAARCLWGCSDSPQFDEK